MPSNIGKKFFTLRMVEGQGRLPREVAELPSSETFKTLLDASLSNLL